MLANVPVRVRETYASALLAILAQSSLRLRPRVYTLNSGPAASRGPGEATTLTRAAVRPAGSPGGGKYQHGIPLESLDSCI